MNVRAPGIDCERLAGEIKLGVPRRFSGFSMFDVFAGGGGSTTGAEAAGAQVCFAINHNSKAIEAHALNHPHTAHCCEDVFRFDFTRAFEVVKKATGHGTPDATWFSPSCVTHSSARSRGVGARGRRGTTPVDDRLRATPWAVTDATYKVSYLARDERRHAPFVIVENVAAFRQWALYPSWREGLHACGYTSSEHLLQALDYGVAAERERLFVVFTPRSVSRTPFKVTPPKRRVLGDKRGGWTEKVAVPKECQLGRHLVRDFGAPGWIACDELTGGHAAKFAYNLARARSMTGGEPPRYWTYQYTTGTKPRFVEHPQRTITAEAGGQLYVVHSAGGEHHQRLARAEELRGWFGFPKDYLLPEAPSAAGRLVGNAVVPAIAESIVRQIMERA